MLLKKLFEEIYIQRMHCWSQEIGCSPSKLDACKMYMGWGQLESGMRRTRMGIILSDIDLCMGIRDTFILPKERIIDKSHKWHLFILSQESNKPVCY